MSRVSTVRARAYVRSRWRDPSTAVGQFVNPRSNFLYVVSGHPKPGEWQGGWVGPDWKIGVAHGRADRPSGRLEEYDVVWGKRVTRVHYIDHVPARRTRMHTSVALTKERLLKQELARLGFGPWQGREWFVCPQWIMKEALVRMQARFEGGEFKPMPVRSSERVVTRDVAMLERLLEYVKSHAHCRADHKGVHFSIPKYMTGRQLHRALEGM